MSTFDLKEKRKSEFANISSAFDMFLEKKLRSKARRTFSIDQGGLTT